MEFVAESLTSPVEFYLTDDTKVPEKIYGAFELDGINYGMALVQTNFDRVYELYFYRVTAKVRKFWNFAKPNHVAVGLATLLKFTESCIPFLNSHLDGIVVSLYAKYSTAERYERLVKRMLARSYVKTWRSVPVEWPDVPDEKKYLNWIFFLRKTKDPAQVFKGKSFKKYSFKGQGSGTFPGPATVAIAPKQAQKPTVSLEPSTKWKVGDLNVTGASFEDDEYLKNIVHDHDTKVVSIHPKLAPLSPHDPKLTDKDAAAEYLKKPEAIPNPTVLPDYLVPVAISDVMPHLTWKIQEKGFNKSLFSIADFNYSLANSKAAPATKAALKAYFADKNLLYADGYLKSSAAVYVESFLEQLSKTINTPDFATSYKYLTQEWIPAHTSMIPGIEEVKSVVEPITGKTYKPSDDIVKTLTDAKVDFKKLDSELDGSGQFVFVKYNPKGIEVGENLNEKVKKLKEEYGGDLGITGLNSTQRSAVKKYTGSDFRDMNNLLRATLDPSHTKLYLGATSYLPSVKKLMSAFKSVKPTSKAMWVYRGSNLMSWQTVNDVHPGKLYVDPGFVSTTLSSSTGFGGNLKLRIYVPRGSRVIPALGFNSKHPGENEVILPPASVLKVIRLDETSSAKVVTCIFTGSVVDDMVAQSDAFKKLEGSEKKEPVMAESRDPKVTPAYKQEDKFSSPVPAKFSRIVKKLIKAKKVKVRK